MSTNSIDHRGLCCSHGAFQDTALRAKLVNILLLGLVASLLGFWAPLLVRFDIGTSKLCARLDLHSSPHFST